MKDVKELFQTKQRPIYLPVCVFVINVRDNRALYAWLAEPLVENQGANLQVLPPDEFHDLNPAAVDEIVDRVKAWYDILAREVILAGV